MLYVLMPGVLGCGRWWSNRGGGGSTSATILGDINWGHPCYHHHNCFRLICFQWGQYYPQFIEKECSLGNLLKTLRQTVYFLIFGSPVTPYFKGIVKQKGFGASFNQFKPVNTGEVFYSELFTEAEFLKSPFLITSTHCHSVHNHVTPQVNFLWDVKIQVVMVPTSWN